MKRVVLIVTGQAELKGLHVSLQQYFQDVQFEPVFRDSFTSSALSETQIFRPDRPTVVEKLATSLIAAVDPGRTGKPADLAVIVDDLELCNVGTPDRVVHHMRAAVTQHIKGRWPNADRRDRCFQLVRERCSFHIFAPMLEAYFFGEPAAVRRAGALREPQLDDTRDLENFETSDEDYRAFSEERVVIDPKLPSGWREESPRHPKRYVQFLCDPTGKNPSAYRETKGGYDALRLLDWSQVLSRREHVRFARAFLLDLADGLERDDLRQQWQGETHPLTSSNARERVLRNL